MMAEERIIIEISDEQLDDALEKADRALEGTQSVDEVVEKILADEKDVSEKLKALEPRLKAILAQIPELRGLMRMLSMMERFAGATGTLTSLLLTVPFILNMINKMRIDIENMKRFQLDHERMIREAKMFTSREQFLQWQNEYYLLLETSKKGDSPL